MKGRLFISACLVIGIAILLGGIELAQGQGIVTDRPGFTESAVTVPLHVLQLEAGGTYTRPMSGYSQVVVGETSLRWGVQQHVEVRVGLPSLVSTSNGASHTGIGDGSIGAKMQLGPLSSGWDLSASGTLSMPIGDDEFSSGKVDPTFIVAAARALNETVGISGQALVSWPTSGDDRDFQWGGTFALSTSLNPQTSAFAEVGVTVPDTGTAPVTGHVGVAHAVSDRFQVDVHAGFGLTDTAPDAFIGAGFATQL